MITNFVHKMLNQFKDIPIICLLLVLISVVYSQRNVCKTTITGKMVITTQVFSVKQQTNETDSTNSELTSKNTIETTYTGSDSNSNIKTSTERNDLDSSDFEQTESRVTKGETIKPVPSTTGPKLGVVITLVVFAILTFSVLALLICVTFYYKVWTKPSEQTFKSVSGKL